MSDITVIEIASPGVQNAFESDREDINRRMQSFAWTCTQCGQERSRDGIKMCGGCKIAMFCSKECQKAHWPTHKRVCRLGSSGLATSLAKRAIANQTLMFILDEYAVYLLELHKDLSNAAKFAVHMICTTVPVDRIRRLLGSNSDPAADDRVMFAIKEIRKAPMESPDFKKAWREGVREAARIGVRGPTVLFYFTSEAKQGGVSVTLSARPIPPEVITSIENGPTVRFPDGYEVPLDMQYLLEEYNHKVERDHENKFGLRR